MSVKKFDDWEQKSKKEDNTKDKEEITLDKDSLELKHKIEKLKDGDFEIVGINDVSLDDPQLKEATIINADINKEVKRGDVLYITAMIKKKNVSWNSMAVIKVRIVDMYNGLSILNTLK